jgi:hypothetical protein
MLWELRSPSVDLLLEARDDDRPKRGVFVWAGEQYRISRERAKRARRRDAATGMWEDVFVVTGRLIPKPQRDYSIAAKVGVNQE